MYCTEYIFYDNYKNRFFFLVFFFIISILLIIFSPNIISILIGWDGLGLISYLLVIYYNNQRSYNSGILTILINRIGDVIIILSIGIMLIYGSWNFLNYKIINFIIIRFIVIAAFTKRAQIPFSAWLPAAIAAPTPVSSLVHSSTLVTAGVYLLIRFSYLLENNKILLNYIIITGLLTIILSGISAIVEYDLKKIIAFSTLSQLGIIIIIFGIKQFNLVFFHLIVHAIFKSIIFICSGAIIHVINDCQDIRKINNIRIRIPLTLSIITIARISLCGGPFLSGFYSKDKILEFSILRNIPILIKIFIYFSIILTIIYRFRLNHFLHFKVNKFIPIKKWNESKIINISILILLLFRITFGIIIKWILFLNIEDLFISFEDKLFFFIICFFSLLISKILFYYKLEYKKIFIFYIKKIWLGNYFFQEIIYYPLFFGKKFIYYYEKGWREYIFKEIINKFMKNNLIKFILINNINSIEFVRIIFFLIIYIIILI